MLYRYEISEYRFTMALASLIYFLFYFISFFLEPFLLSPCVCVYAGKFHSSLNGDKDKMAVSYKVNWPIYFSEPLNKLITKKHSRVHCCFSAKCVWWWWKYWRVYIYFVIHIQALDVAEAIVIASSVINDINLYT